MAGHDTGLLESILFELLGERPEGIGEYDLIKLLQGSGRGCLPAAPLASHLGLYRTHFLLFHALYRLRDRLWRERRGSVVIGPLRIAIEPYHDGDAALTLPDPLRAYYLDLGNLENTTEADVDALLDSFWMAFGARDRRGAALSVLGLADPVDALAIKQRYRQLAMEHHPDRGGDAERFKAIQAAMRDLAF